MLHLLLVFIALWPMTARTQPCVSAACSARFPADSGILNVRDFGAKGDGKTDDTAALRAALAASGGDTGVKIWRDRIVYLPAGTYLVSDTILKKYAGGLFASGMILIGESADRTIIRLADHAAGFGDVGNPRAVVMTASKRLDKSTNRDYVHLGEGNDAYENFVQNMTIDVGSGNPGAIGLDYLANNIGAVRDVDIVAHPGSGAIGLSMRRKFPGPALVQRISIEGFAVGAEIDNSEYGMTLSQVRMTGQRDVGLRNVGNVVSAEDLSIAKFAGRSLSNLGPNGLVVLLGGNIAKGGAGTIRNAGTIVFHGTIVSSGLAPTVPTGGPLNGWLRGADDWHQGVDTPPPALAPIVDAGPAGKWVGVDGTAYDAAPADSTARLQSAFDSGASTIYLRQGTFWISAPIEIPRSVHRVIGMNSSIQIFPKRQAGFTPLEGMFHIKAGGDPLEIDRLALDNSERGAQLGIDDGSDRTLILSDVLGIGVMMLDRRAEGGPVFLEDTTGSRIRIAGPAAVVARQFNPEGRGIQVQSDGTQFTVIGLKTEKNCTIVSGRDGARTEIYGGLIYLVVATPQSELRPAFVSEDSQLFASFVEESGRPDSHYQVLLVDQQHGRRVEIPEEAMPKRGLGRMVPMLTTERRSAP